MDPPDAPLGFHLCPQCGRAVPAGRAERHCPNDGTRLIRACPACHAAILSPYALHCARCGAPLRRPPEVLP